MKSSKYFNCSCIHKIDLKIEGEKSPLKARNSPLFKEYFNLLWKELDFDEQA